MLATACKAEPTPFLGAIQFKGLCGMGTSRSALATAILALSSGLSIASTPVADTERPPALDCKSGPLHRTYGNGDWLVYGCSDARSMVVVSDVGNPASPFVFIFYVKPDGSMQLYGEGDGNRSETKAAFDELKTLGRPDVALLVSQAEAIGGGD